MRLLGFGAGACACDTEFSVIAKGAGVALLAQLLLATPTIAQVPIPNVQQGAPGTLLQGPVDPAMGRTAIIEFMDGYIVTIPETPGSESTDHTTVKAWNISDPANPFAQPPVNPNQNGGHFGNTANPFLAHGAIRRDNELLFYTGSGNSGNGLDALRLNSDGSLEHARWSGQNEPPLYDRDGNRYGNEYAQWWSKGGLFRPWAMTDNWMYNNNSSTQARLTLRDRVLAEWDVTADTGVTGFGLFMGNLLIYASDQRNTGVAVYDATDVSFDSASGQWKPRLLDTLNSPLNQGGIGGYWSEISGHRLILARQRRDDLNPNFFAGIQVVDFSDPTNLRLTCNIEFEDRLGQHHWTLSPRPQYVGVQDEFAFVDAYKVNIETCDVVLELDKTQGRRGNLCYGPENPCPMVTLDTSQYSRVVGNLWITGGIPFVPGTDGMGIWVHQSAPDRRAPYIAHHVPGANQRNYPTNAPLSFSIPETLQSTSIVVTATADPGEAQTVTVTEVGGDRVDIDYVISHTGMLTVEPLKGLKGDTTYEVAFTNGIRDAVGNAMAPYSFRFATGNSIIDDDPADPAVIDGIDILPGRQVNVDDQVSVNVRSANATEYEIVLDSESNRWTANSSRSFTFSAAGTYSINVRARNEDGTSALERVQVVVIQPETALPPGKHSSQLACDVDNGRVWAVNQDNDSVAILAAADLSKIDEVTGIDGARSAARLANNEVWVAARDADRVFVLDADSFSIKRSFSTGYGTAPAHILGSNDGSQAYISLYGSGQLARYSVANQSENGRRLDLAPTVKTLALTPDGDTLLVARFMSAGLFGEVFEIDVNSWSQRRVYRLHRHMQDDDLDEGRGLPNYVDGIVINGQGNRAYVVAKKDNVDRGLLNGLNIDLDDDNMVRTLGMTLDLERGVELKGQRVDFDNTSSMSALSMSNDSRHLFVAMQGKNNVLAMEIGGDLRFTGKTYDYSVGLAPQGLCFDASQNKLYVKNFTDRSVTSLDFSNGYLSPAATTTNTVANETLTASELSGLQVFYNAFDGLSDSTPTGRMSAEGYVSCASCHIEGADDGNVYDFSGRGEGLRNTISLKGRGGTRFGDVHWSSNFDEIQDFEHDIREVFKGRGFMSDSDFNGANTPLGAPKAGLSKALDDLDAYVSSLGKASLPRSPNRNADGSMTGAGVAGQSLFKSLGCIDCHSGTAMTDKTQHDIGTMRSHSGGRLGENLQGIKTPSLLGAFATAPYLHDGSADTLKQVFSTVGGDVIQAETATSLNNAEMIEQVGYSYLRGAKGMRLLGNGSSITLNVDAGSGGASRLRVRYGSSDGGQLKISVNGESQPRQTISLRALPQIESQDALFAETDSVALDLAAGSQNLVLEYEGSGVLIDEVTLATSDVVKAATPHLQVAALNSAEQANLMAFLAQIDQALAPEDDDDDIFSNDEEPPVEVGVSLIDPAAVKESAGQVLVEARLSAAHSSDVVIAVHTRPVTAKNGADYYGLTQRFTIKAGDISASIPVVVLRDGEAENTETFELRLFEADGAVINDAVAVVSIDDDGADALPVVSVADGQVTEGDSHAIELTLSSASSSEVTVHVATAPGSAQPGRDYYGLYKIVTFAPGETQKGVQVFIFDDTEVESEEAFSQRIFLPRGAVLGRDQGQTRVIDND